MKSHGLMRNGFLAVALAFSLGACGGTDDEQQEQKGPGEVLTSSLERNLAPAPSAAARQQLSADNRDFAFNLFQEIRENEDSNIFYSPHSISIALAMTYAGAGGETQAQMAEVLRFGLEESELHTAFNALDLELAQRSKVEVESGDAPQLNVVNATWGQHDYPFSSSYLDTLAVNYGAGLRAVDFQNAPNEVREEINQWVEDQTNDRIKNLLPEGSIDSSTALVLTNAIYFLAGWENEFPKSATVDAPFVRHDGSEVTVDLMHNSGGFLHYLGDETLAVSLPYVGGELAFIALMPTDAADYDAWEAGLNRERFDAVIEGMTVASGQVALPRFRFEGEYDAKVLFESMGWTNFADLSRMVEGGSSGLEITAILHKSFIALDEEGTEAAAATAVVVGETAGPIDSFEMKFDRPFAYVIYDKPTDTILFLGRVSDPTAE